MGRFPHNKRCCEVTCSLESSWLFTRVCHHYWRKKHDIKVGRTLNFPKGSIVAIDKAYNDYSWYKQLTDKGIFFVTRFKKMLNSGWFIVDHC